MPNAYRFSGALMPARRILCRTFASSSTVSMSPPVIATMLPVNVERGWSAGKRNAGMTIAVWQNTKQAPLPVSAAMARQRRS